MVFALSFRARSQALAIALLAAASLVAQWLYLMELRGTAPGETLGEMARYFTTLTNALVALTFLVLARRRRPPGALWPAVLTLSIALVAGVYHAVLSHLWNPTGLGWWADLGLHGAVPLAVALWWAAHAPKRGLGWGDIPAFLVWPAIYAAATLGLARRDGVYPYPFMDVGLHGPAAVAVTLAMLGVLVLLAGTAMIALARALDR